MLTELLSRICALQKGYGKTQAELETLVEGFSWALVGYPMSDVNLAFQAYIVTQSDIPAPADIIKLIRSNKQSDEATPPTVSQLLEYRSRGIPLSPKQQADLQEYERSGAHHG
ncbi:hypothetical protein [Limnoglobus roseus]|nr:hypothetical protein [Limnoglobus roseus]